MCFPHEQKVQLVPCIVFETSTADVQVGHYVTYLIVSYCGWNKVELFYTCTFVSIMVNTSYKCEANI